jgi:hypothetical protein
VSIEMNPAAGDSDYVYVPVPASRVDDVFRFLLGLGKEEMAEGPDLEERLGRVYRESDGQFRRLLRLLADRAGQPLSSEEVADALELERGTASLAGMLGAYGRRSNNRYESFWPFERLYNASAETSEFVMPKRIAAIVKEIAP